MSENNLLQSSSHYKNRRDAGVEEPTPAYFYSSIEKPISKPNQGGLIW